MDVIIGTMRWGQWGEKLDLSAQSQLIEKAVENGFCTFDAADIYGAYTGEAEFGKALAQSSVERKDIQIITKCGICYPADQSPYQTKSYDTSASHIRASVEQSLSHFQTHYLDYLLIHRPSPLMDFREVAETIIQLKEEQKVRHFGVSNFNPQQVEFLKTFIDIETHQIEYSLTQPKALFDNTIQQAQIENFPIMAWSPLGSFYSHKTSEELKITVAAFAQKYQCSENLILLSWLGKNPAQILPVVGTTKVERIEELQSLPNLQIENEDWYLLLEKSRGVRVD